MQPHIVVCSQFASRCTRNPLQHLLLLSPPHPHLPHDPRMCFPFPSNAMFPKRRCVMYLIYFPILFAYSLRTAGFIFMILVSLHGQNTRPYSQIQPFRKAPLIIPKSTATNQPARQILKYNTKKNERTRKIVQTKPTKSNEQKSTRIKILFSSFSTDYLSRVCSSPAKGSLNYHFICSVLNMCAFFFTNIYIYFSLDSNSVCEADTRKKTFSFLLPDGAHLARNQFAFWQICCILFAK